MKKIILGMTILALVGTQVQPVKAGGCGGVGIAAGIVAGVAAGAIIATSVSHPAFCAPAPAYYYSPPPVVYQPAPPVVAYQPAPVVVCAQPACYAPTPVVSIGIGFGYGPRPYYHGGYYHGRPVYRGHR